MAKNKQYPQQPSTGKIAITTSQQPAATPAVPPPEAFDPLNIGRGVTTPVIAVVEFPDGDPRGPIDGPGPDDNTWDPPGDDAEDSGGDADGGPADSDATAAPGPGDADTPGTVNAMPPNMDEIITWGADAPPREHRRGEIPSIEHVDELGYFDPAAQGAGNAQQQETQTVTTPTNTAPAPFNPLAELAASTPKPELPAALRNQFGYLDTYAVGMRPRLPVSDQTVNDFQVGFFRAMSFILNESKENFDEAFTELLGWIQAHSNDVLGLRYIFRGVENLTLSDADGRAFRRLTIFLRNIADPVSREVQLRQTDLEAALRFGLTEQTRQRILNYLGK